MKKTIISIFAILYLMQLVLGGIQFYEVRNNRSNNVIENRMTICYDKEMDAVLPNINDYVSGNNFYETYITYDIYVNKWNNDNPNYFIDYCNMSIKQSTKLTNYTELEYIYLNQNDLDLFNIKYFLKMKDGDCVIAEQQCKYNEFSLTSYYDMPAEMKLVTPTYECKACQSYEASLIEREIDKTNTINNNKSRIMNFIKKFIELNFELLLTLFWLFSILMLFIAVGFIFFIFYWLYIYIERLGK